MIRSWFIVFMCLAAAIFLTFYRYWHLALIMAAVLFLTGIYREDYSKEAFAGMIVLIAGILYSQLTVQPVSVQLPQIDGAVITGKVKTYPQHYDKKTSFVLQTDSDDPYQRKLRVLCYFNAEVGKGDRVRIRGVLQPPARPGNPGEFDYSAYLAYDRIYYILEVKEAEDVEIISRGVGLESYFSSYRLRGEEIIRNILPPEEAAVLLGMLLGQKEALEAERYSEFQKIGVAHVFAVSGLHVGFVLLLSSWLSSLLGFSRKTKFYFGVCCLFVYGSVVGWPISVVRASIMALLGLFAYYMGQENSFMNSLGIAGIVILLLNPYDLFKISFQLSFLATWGLVCIFPLVKKFWGYQSRLWDLVLIPLCSQIAVLPLVAFYFNLFTPVSIISNIAVMYAVGAAVMLGFMSLLVNGFFPVLASIFLYPAGFFIELILKVSEFLEDLPAAFLLVATPSPAMIAVYYVGLLLIVSSLSNPFYKKRFAAGLFLMVLFLAVLCFPASYRGQGVMEVVFIDVGQGDSILLKTPQGKFLLVDGGGSDFYDVGARKVLPYLHHRGIRDLWLVFNTHPDTDHLQGLETVVEEMPVHFVALPASLIEAGAYQPLKEASLRKKSSIVPLRSGQSINIEKGLKIKVLNPQEEDVCPSKGTNDQSLVLHIQYRDFSVLLTGDIEKNSLQFLVQNEKLSPTTVVKVPHHGSSDSLVPEFYDRTKPRWAVISVGDNNFGHPHEKVLNALQERDIEVLRTDAHGAVKFSSDGEFVKIETGADHM